MPQLISKIFELETRGSGELENRLVIFLLPYVLIFILLILLQKNLDKVLRLFKSIGFIFLLMSIFMCYERYVAFNAKPVLFSDKIELNKLNKEKKVIWFIFDGFDPDIAFYNNKLSLDLNNFNEIRKNSFEHKNLYPPSKDTHISIPSMLLGHHPVGQNIYKNYGIYLNSEIGPVRFNYKNSIFHKLEKKGLSTSIFSSVYAYCALLPEINSCFSTENLDVKPSVYRWHNGITFIFSIHIKTKFFVRLLKNKNPDKEMKIKSKKKLKYTYIDNFEQIKIAKPKIDIDALELIDMRDCCKDVYHYHDLKNYFKNLNKNLTFIHIFSPHTTGQQHDFAQEVFKINTTLDGKAKGINSYMLNLKLTDLLLEKILKLIKAEDKKNLMIILSSDHWYRDKDKRSRNAYPALFIVKIYNDNKKILMSKNSSAYHVNEMIINYFDDKINNHQDIKTFYENKEFKKTFMVH